MKLNREYTCSDLCKVLDAKCENSNDNIFNQISTLTQPLKDSLGFVSTKEISQDISKFSGLIVPNDFKTDIKTSVPLFKTENVMHSLSNLLSNSQLTLHYSSSDIFHNVTIGSNVSIGKIGRAHV